MMSNIISINDGLYRIAAEKYNRDLTVVDFTQIMDVSYKCKNKILQTNNNRYYYGTIYNINKTIL